MHKQKDLMNKNAIKAEIKSLIGVSKIDLALELLSEKCTNNMQLSGILLQKARFYRLKNELRDGLISKPNFNQELNSLVKSTLEIADECEFNDLVEEKKYPIKEYRTEFNLSFTRITVAKFLIDKYKEDNALTLSSIKKDSGANSRKLTRDFLFELKELNLIENRSVDKQELWKLAEEGAKHLKKWLRN